MIIRLSLLSKSYKIFIFTLATANKNKSKPTL